MGVRPATSPIDLRRRRSGGVIHRRQPLVDARIELRRRKRRWANRFVERSRAFEARHRGELIGTLHGDANATPPFDPRARSRYASTSWSASQSGSITHAGALKVPQRNAKNQTRRILVRAKRTWNAPIAPAIAPD